MSNPEHPRCINPKCREPLFTPAAKMCHKCFMIQLPEQQQTAPSGPGPPTQLPSRSEDRQSRTHADPIHPPPSGPGIQSSGSQQGNRDGSGNTSKEQSFDAQSHHSQTARSYHREGPPPSSQPNIPQTYQYPQVFGMPQHPRGPGSQGTPVPPFPPGSQPPNYPPPPGIQGGQWLWLPALQQYVFAPHASSQMVHGQISPQSMPSPQPHTWQPQSPREMPPPQPPTSQSQPQSPREMPPPQPPTSQSQLPSSAGKPHHQSHSSQPQPSGTLSPQLHTSNPPQEAHPAQPSLPQSSQQPQSPSGGAPLHQQPTGAAPPSESAQSSQERGTTLPQGHETDRQTQVSTTISKPSDPKSPASPKPESFPPPSSHPSAASPVPATSSTEKFQAADPRTKKEHLPDTGKGTNSKVPDKDSNAEQSSTQAQPTNTPPKATTSFSDTSSHPLQGTSDNPKEGSNQGSENNNKGRRKRSTDSDDSGNIPAKLAKQEEGTKKEHNKEPSNDKDAKGGTSEQLSEEPLEEPPKDKQPIKPENPVSQHTGDSQAGSAPSAAMTKQNQVSLLVYTVISCFIKVPNSLECAVWSVKQ